MSRQVDQALHGQTGGKAENRQRASEVERGGTRDVADLPLQGYERGSAVFRPGLSEERETKADGRRQ